MKKVEKLCECVCVKERKKEGERELQLGQLTLQGIGMVISLTTEEGVQIPLGKRIDMKIQNMKNIKTEELTIIQGES